MLSDIDTAQKIERLSYTILTHKKFPIGLHIFLIDENQYIKLMNGHFERALALSWTDYLKAERGEILDLFAKLEFLVNEIMLFRIAGTDSKRLELLEDILEVVDFGFRLRLLKEWKVLTDTDIDTKLKLLLKVRNGLAHRWRIDEVEYRNVRLKANFEKFKTDMEAVLRHLIEKHKQEFTESVDVEKIALEIERFNEPAGP